MGRSKNRPQKIFVKGNKLIVLDEKPAFAQTKTNKTKAYSHLRQPKKMKGTGKLENPEEILSRLEFLALNDFNEVVDILYDFENYFDYQTDGAITEQWKDAVATVKWITE